MPSRKLFNQVVNGLLNSDDVDLPGFKAAVACYKKRDFQHKQQIDTDDSDHSARFDILRDVLDCGAERARRMLGGIDRSSPTDHEKAVLDAVRILGETVVLGCIPFCHAERDVAPLNVFYWPGYDRLQAAENVTRTIRTALLVDGKETGVGLRITRGDPISVSACGECPATLAFDNALSSRNWDEALKREFVPGGTHSWLSAWGERMRDQYHPLRILRIGMPIAGDRSADVTEQRKHGCLGVELSASDPKLWGQTIAEKLNKDAVLNGGPPWPYSEAYKRTPKDANNYRQKLRESLYSTWLLACFKPSSVSSSNMQALFGKDESQSGLRSKVIKQLNVGEWKKKNKDVSFSHWYTLALAESVAHEPNSHECIHLGTGMVLCSHEVSLTALSTIAAWLDIMHRDLRIFDGTFLVAQQAETLRRREGFNATAHLVGVERDVVRLVSEIDDLRSRATTIQTRINPASVGLPARAQELIALFEENKELAVEISTPEHKVLSKNEFNKTMNKSSLMFRLRHLEREPYDNAYDLLSTLEKDIRKKLWKGRTGGDAQPPAWRVKGIHDPDGNAGNETTRANLLDVIRAFGEITDITILKEIGNCAVQRHQSNHLRLAKLIIQRHVAPDYANEEKLGSRQAYVYDAQLLATLAEAIGDKKGGRIEFKYSREDDPQFDIVGVGSVIADCIAKAAGFLIENVSKLEDHCKSLNCCLLPEGKRPVDLLGPLFQLVRVELRQKRKGAKASDPESKRASLSKVTVVSRKDALTVVLECDKALSLRALHCRDESIAGQHGLSGALWLKRWALPLLRSAVSQV